jgi:hypothetical protein
MLPRDTQARFHTAGTGSVAHPFSRSLRFGALIAFSLGAAAACGDSTSPPDTTYANPTGTNTASAVAVVGPGEGGVSVTPKAIPEGYFDAEIKVRVRKAMPSTTYIVQRAPEIGRASASNGICERALGLAPWSSADTPAPAFITFVPSG